MSEYDLDVLVVGAGPTGLTLAILLERYGVNYRLVDRKEGPSTRSKATQINPRTLEIFEDLEILSEAVEIGQHVHGLTIYAGDQRIVHSTYDEFDAPYPYLLNLGQFHTERLLVQRLAGSSPQWQTEMTGFTADQSGATITLRTSQGSEETIRARYLVGCDGARSLTRNTLDLDFEGTTYAYDTMLGDVRLEWEFPRDEALVFLESTSALVVSPIPDGRYQIAADFPLVNDKSRKSQGITPTLKELQETFNKRCPFKATLRDSIWLTYYATHARNVSHLRQGPAFLAGDSAHLTSPLTGLGLNQGIQDAYNLGWKLGLVLTGQAQASLLDSYSPERVASLPNLKRFSDLQTSVMIPRRPIGYKLREKLVEITANIDLFWRRAYRDTSQLDWGYRQSPIVEDYAGIPLHLPSAQHLVDHGSCIRAWSNFGAGPHAGDRAPDCAKLTMAQGERQRLYPHLIGGKHHLLLLVGCEQPQEAVCKNFDLIAHTTEEQYGDMIEVHLVVPSDINRSGICWNGSTLFDHDRDCHNRYGAYGECLYLVRPDGHVAFRSQPPVLEKLLAYLQKIFARTPILV